ncbi:MAG: TetR family transcriptional regulator C-terminal domain-containing protein [Raineya sp.]|jgi:hypothetical protein|nr:TetR family transcriptional regulator C-terminal domain-containing protein [Raineya sp.]
MAKQNKNKTNESTPNWQELYIQFVLEHNKRPQSAYEFCKFSSLSEETFYETYGTIDALESDIWLYFFTETKSQIQADEQYQAYSVREKLLAFDYTWLENLRSYRSFITLVLSSHSSPMWQKKASFAKFKEEFTNYAQELLSEAQETGEVKNRNVINNAYPKVLWGQTLYLLNFWIKDSSSNFEQTDAAVEKTVNLFFDMAGHSFIDSFVDFAKFSFQSFKF